MSPSIRERLAEALRTDPDIDAFCLDCFRAVFDRFSSGMDRVTKVNLLLTLAEGDEVGRRLNEWTERRLTGAPRAGRTELQTLLHRPSLQPPGGAYTAAWYVPRPRAERDALSYLVTPGKPAILWGPELFGKTWLFHHLLDRLTAACRIVRLSLDAFEDASRQSYGAFLRELASCFAEGLQHGENWLAVAWEQAGSRGPNRRLSVVLRQLLSEQQEPLVLAIDRADAILSCDFRDDFFGLLRSWAEDGREPWTRLRLLLAVSATPIRLTKSIYNSPFSGLTEPIELDELAAEQVQQLAERYGLPWECGDNLTRLVGLVGGHPYLIRLVMHEAALHGTLLEDLWTGQVGTRLFERHLLRCRRLLRNNPGLFQALRNAGRDAQSHIDPETYEQLHRLGLLVRDVSGGHRLRCKLYERLLD